MPRAVVRLGMLLVLIFVVTPSGSGQYPSCQICTSGGTGESAMVWCAEPHPEGWGYETCTIETFPNGVHYCRARGVGCYYLDVQG